METFLELLLNISRELATSPDLRTVLERILYHATQSVGAERGSLFAITASGQPLEAVLVVDGQLHHPSVFEVTDILNHGLAGWVASKRQPVLVQNTLEDERWLRRPDDDCSATGAKSTVCVPLLAQDQLTGLLPELIDLLRQRLNNLRSGRVPLEDLLVVQLLGVDQEQLEAWIEGGYAVSLPCMQC